MSAKRSPAASGRKKGDDKARPAGAVEATRGRASAPAGSQTTAVGDAAPVGRYRRRDMRAVK